MVALRAMVTLAKGLVDSRLDERNAIEVRKGRPGWRGHREGETPADGDNPAGLDLEQAEARERRVARMEASGRSFERSDSAYDAAVETRGFLEAEPDAAPAPAPPRRFFSDMSRDLEAGAWGNLGDFGLGALSGGDGGGAEVLNSTRVWARVAAAWLGRVRKRRIVPVVSGPDGLVKW